MIHISQIYSCSKIDLACELYYVCELGKYIKYNYDDVLSLEGVILDSVLMKSKFWTYLRVALKEGWVTGVDIDESEAIVYSLVDCKNYLITTDTVLFDSADSVKRANDAEYALCTPMRAQISFEEMTSSQWLWSVSGYEGKFFNVNNNITNHNYADQSWLSILAFVAIHRFYEKSPESLKLVIGANSILNPMALSYIILLAEETLALDGWLYVDDSSLPDMSQNQLGYASWYAKGRDRGMLNTNSEYTITQKKKYLTEDLDIGVGDLVMYYTRMKFQDRNDIKAIQSCNLAKVVEISRDSVTLERILNTKPYYTAKSDFDSNSTAVKAMYKYDEFKPYEKLRTSVQVCDLRSTGVEYMMTKERTFINPLEGSSDYIVVTVCNGKTEDKLLLDQNNWIYWILKDYNYDFNEDKFLRKYFPNSEPLYTQYMRGDTLDACYYVE